MALLSGLQQQHQQEQKQRQLAVASPAPSHLTMTSSSVPPVSHQEKTTDTPILAPVRKPITTAAAADYADEHAPSKAQKLKKKKSFLARIAENNKNLSPKDPSFWCPRDAAQAKRFGRGAPKGTAQSKMKEVSPSPPPAVTASSSPAPLAQHHPQAALSPPLPPPYQAQAAASAAPSAVPSIPAPPFALPQIPAGGYLYYCPPTAQPEVVVSSPTAAAAATPDTEASAAQKPMYRVNATVYNPRQGNPGDRCTIM